MPKWNGRIPFVYWKNGRSHLIMKSEKGDIPKNRKALAMGKSLTRKIIESHFVSGSMVPGEEVFIHVDQTLTHDINAVMTFEAVGLDRVRTECSVSYLDHNLLYVNNMTPDDHIYLQSAAKKFGVYVSRPGNGICHTVHVARFGVPGKISMGGDSHTPHGGAIGMLCIGVGGMDVATAMTGVPMRLKMPKVAALARFTSMSAPALPHWRCPSGPPLPTWARRWALPPPSSRRTTR